MARFKSLGTGIWVSPDSEIGESVSIGHASCVGFEDNESQSRKVVIGDRVKIGASYIIYVGASLGHDVEIDHYCRVGLGTHIGNNTKILYGAQVFNNASVGQNCIVAGEVVNRMVIEDNVTFMGLVAHSHRDPNVEWDITEEESPIIKSGSVIGLNAMIIGGVKIGPGSYVAAGETVRIDVPPGTVFYNGKMSSIKDWRGVIKTRSEGGK